MSMDSLYKASYQVMVNEEEGMSTKLRQLVMAGLIKEKKDLPYFKSAMKKVKGGAVTSVQERQVLINVLNQFLELILTISKIRKNTHIFILHNLYT